MALLQKFEETSDYKIKKCINMYISSEKNGQTELLNLHKLAKKFPAFNSIFTTESKVLVNLRAKFCDKVLRCT